MAPLSSDFQGSTSSTSVINEVLRGLRSESLLQEYAKDRKADLKVEEVMDYRTQTCGNAKPRSKPNSDFLLGQGGEQSPKIDIPSW